MTAGIAARQKRPAARHYARSARCAAIVSSGSLMGSQGVGRACIRCSASSSESNSLCFATKTYGNSSIPCDRSASRMADESSRPQSPVNLSSVVPFVRHCRLMVCKRVWGSGGESLFRYAGHDAAGIRSDIAGDSRGHVNMRIHIPATSARPAAATSRRQSFEVSSARCGTEKRPPAPQFWKLVQVDAIDLAPLEPLATPQFGAEKTALETSEFLEESARKSLVGL